MLTRTLGRWWQTVRWGLRAARPGPLDWILSIARTRRVCKLGRFTPQEAFGLGLLHPHLPNHPLEQFISRKNLTKLQQRLNPEALEPGLRNKALFYRCCEAAGLPTPAMHALLFPAALGWASDGSRLASEDDWAEYLSRRIAPEFFAKPIYGSYHRGVGSFTRADDSATFTDHLGRRHDARQLHGFLREVGDRQGMVLQQCLRAHPAVAALGRSEHAPTVRVTTLMNSPAECRILEARLRCVVGNRVRNASGAVETIASLQLLLDPASGQATVGVTYRRNEPAVRTLDVHPESGVRIADFVVPGWAGVRELVCRAAALFHPVRAIGWDILVTESGPVLLEGNVAWDPMNQHVAVGRVMAEVARAAGMELAMPYHRPVTR